MCEVELMIKKIKKAILVKKMIAQHTYCCR